MRKHTKKILCTILVVLAAGVCASVALAATNFDVAPQSPLFADLPYGTAPTESKSIIITNKNSGTFDFDIITVASSYTGSGSISDFVVAGISSGGPIGSGLGTGDTLGFTISLADSIKTKSGTHVLTMKFSEGGETETVVATVTVGAPSPDNDIIDFSILGISLTDLNIDTTTHKVTAKVPAATDLTSLAPTFTLSPGASISPTTAQNFSSPFTYTVTAQDGTPQGWEITLTELPSTTVLTASKTGFSFSPAAGATASDTFTLKNTGSIAATNISITATPPGSITLTNLITSLASGATSSAITVTAAAGTYTGAITISDTTTNTFSTITIPVTVTAPSTSTDNTITNFAIPNMISATPNAAAGTIAVTMPYGTDVTKLTPTFTIHSAARVDKASGTQQNFSSPVTYTVTAGNGTPKSWTVTVSVQQVGMKTFYLAGVAGTIKTTGASTGTIDVDLPYGTNKTSLIPTYTFDGSSCSLVSGAAINFTNPQTVTVYAPPGGTNMVYTVTANVASSPSAECNITSFSIPNMLTSPTINHTAGTILVTLPLGSSVTSLTPTVTVSTGATLISPSSTTVNFTNPVTYTVRAQNGTTTKSYVVTVTLSSSSSQDGNYYSRTITDTIGVSVSGSAIHGSATLSVTENSLHSAGSCSACDHIRSWMAINRVVKCYNISLTNGFTGSITVSIPVGSSHNGNQLTMLHCNNGVLERTNATVNNGSISASYTSLSPFAVLDGVYSSLPSDSADPPKTGDEDIYFSWGALLITLALFLATVCGMILLNKRRNALN